MKEKEHTDPSERRSVSQCGVRKRERLQGESSHSSLAIGSHHRPQQPQRLCFGLLLVT